MTDAISDVQYAAPVLIDDAQDNRIREVEGRLPECLAHQLREVLRSSRVDHIGSIDLLLSGDSHSRDRWGYVQV